METKETTTDKLQQLRDSVSALERSLRQNREELEKGMSSVADRIASLQAQKQEDAAGTAALNAQKQEEADFYKSLINNELCDRLEQSALALGLKEEAAWLWKDLEDAFTMYTRLSAVQKLLDNAQTGSVVPSFPSKALDPDVKLAEQAAHAFTRTGKGHAYVVLAQRFAALQSSSGASRWITDDLHPTMEDLQEMVNTALDGLPADIKLLLADTAEDQTLLEEQLAGQTINYMPLMVPCISP